VERVYRVKTLYRWTRDTMISDWRQYTEWRYCTFRKETV